MNANCVICADLFEESNEIVAAPCGHVYHASCLMTWVRKSKSCPQCRKRTVELGIMKLYFNFLPQTENNSSDLECEIAVLTSLLHSKESELRACMRDIDDQYAYMCSAEKNTSDLYVNISGLQCEVDHLREKVRSLSMLDAQIFDLEQINKALTSDLDHFRSIHAIINGTQKDVEDILRKHRNHLNSAEQIATYCARLKRELIEAVQDKRNLMQWNSKLAYENSVYAAQLKFYEDAMGVPRTESTENVTAPSPPAPVSVTPNFLSDTPCASKDCVCEECSSPVSVTFNTNKLNFRIEASNGVCKSASNSQTSLEYAHVASGVIRKHDDCSIIRIQYNGLESCGKVTAPSKFIKKMNNA